VRRDGQIASIPASAIVTGDILALEAGDLVAADARILEAASFKCIESALTGESEAVTKQLAALAPGDIPLGDLENMVFMYSVWVPSMPRSALRCFPSPLKSLRVTLADKLHLRSSP